MGSSSPRMDNHISPARASAGSPTRILAPLPSSLSSPSVLTVARSRRSRPYPQVTRRIVSTGSLPNAQDPFSSSVVPDPRPAAAARTDDTLYPGLPTSTVNHSGRPQLNREVRTGSTMGVQAAITPIQPTRSRNSSSSTPRSPPRDACDWTPAQIDAEIEKAITMRLTDVERAEKGMGRNYVFDVELASTGDSTPAKRLVKIGCTAKSEYTRLCEIRNTCQHLSITLGVPRDSPGRRRRAGSIPLQTREQLQAQRDHPYAPAPPVPVRLYKRVEKLVHAELAARRYTFTCVCGTEHREYFDVDRETALRVQDKWRAFVTRHGEPYDGQGNLLPFWRHRLLHRHQHQHRVVVTPPPPGGSDGDDDGGGRRQQALRHREWQAFVEPSVWERLWYDAAVVAGKLWRRRWQALTLLQAFFIACCLFPCFPAFMLFSFVSVGIMLESGFEERLYSFGRMEGIRKWAFSYLVW